MRVVVELPQAEGAAIIDWREKITKAESGAENLARGLERGLLSVR